eukprot:TRINITY_DN20171_c0_g1_i1.p1 TRINITY_DN20171_c0_g1~~TRINITY_DN20171_c0_g1_i1.p1  ORF type:complete len:294 (-),score=41.85 TRINITY_DN20171_c0_g1_i1:196-1047(-)
MESLIWRHVSSKLVVRGEMNKLFASLYERTGTLNPLDLTCDVETGSLILGVLDKVDMEASSFGKRLQHCSLFYSPFRVEVSLFIRGMVLSALNFQHSHALTASKLWESLRDFGALADTVPLHNFISLVDVMHFIICALCRDGKVSQAKEALYLQGHLVAFFPAGQPILADGIRCIKEAEARSSSPPPAALPTFIPDLFVPFVTDFTHARKDKTGQPLPGFLSDATAATTVAAASVAGSSQTPTPGCPAHQGENGGNGDGVDATNATTPPFLFSADFFVPPGSI